MAIIVTDDFSGSGDLDAGKWASPPSDDLLEGTTAPGLQQISGACTTDPLVSDEIHKGEAVGIQDPVSPDYKITANISAEYTAFGGDISYITLFLRTTPLPAFASTGYYCQITPVNSGGNNVSFYIDSMAGLSEADTIAVNVADPTNFEVVFEADGDDLRVTVDGVEIYNETIVSGPIADAGNAAINMVNVQVSGGPGGDLKILDVLVESLASPVEMDPGDGEGVLLPMIGDADTGANGVGVLSTIQAYNPISGTLNKPLFSQPYTFIAIGTAGEGPLGLSASLPRITLTAYGGASTNLKPPKILGAKLPHITATISAQVTIIGRLEAELPTLTISAGVGAAPIIGRLNKRLFDHGNGTLTHYSLDGRGGAIGGGALPVPTVLATGDGIDIGRLNVKLPRHYRLSAYGGAALSKELPTLTATLAGSATVIGRLNARLPRRMDLDAVGGGSMRADLPTVTVTVAGSASVIGRISGFLPNGERAGTLPGITLEAYGGASMQVSLPSITAMVTGVGVNIGRLNAKLPKHISVVAAGGASMKKSLPSLTVSVAGSAVVVGRLNAELFKRASKYTVAAVGGAVAKADLPALTLSTTGSAAVVGRLEVDLPHPMTLEGAGTVTIVGRLDAELPFRLQLETEVTLPILGRLNALLPALRMVLSGRSTARLPVLTLIATGTVGETSPEYEAYSITLLPDGSVAITRIDNYPFDQIVRWGSKYYGVNETEIFELGGDTFDGDPIIATIETMPTDFEYAGFKRAIELYLSGRVGANFDVDVLKDEIRSQGYREYRPALQDGTRTHRVRFEKGNRAHFVAYRLTNVDGENFSIDALTPGVVLLRRGI